MKIERLSILSKKEDIFSLSYWNRLQKDWLIKHKPIRYLKKKIKTYSNFQGYQIYDQSVHCGKLPYIFPQMNILSANVKTYLKK